MSNTRNPEFSLSVDTIIDDHGHESEIFCVEHKGKGFLLLEKQDYLCVIEAIEAFVTRPGIINPSGHPLKASVEEIKVVGDDGVETSLYNVSCPPNESLTLESISELSVLMADMKLFYMIRKKGSCR